LSKKLRIGLLMDSLNVPAWTCALIENVLRLNCARVVLVVLNDGESRRPRQESWLSRQIQARKTLLYNLYWLMEERLFKCSPDASEPKDVSVLLAGIPLIKVRPRRTSHSDYFEDRDVEAVRGANVDVLIRLGFRIVRGDILNAARFGIWSYHHGDNDVNRGGPPGFWEVIEKSRTTGCVLQILTEEMDNGKILYKSFGPAFPLSVRRNQHYLFWKSVSFIPRKLAELHRTGAARFFDRIRAKPEPLSFYSNRLYRKPGNAESLRCILLLLKRYVQYRIFHLFFREQWLLLHLLAGKPSTELWKFHRTVPPKDRFWADPHLVYRDGRHFIFVEEFIYKKDRGHLSVLTMNDPCRISEPRIILEKPYHLSNPFVFEHRGQTYLVPESASNRTVDLYRSTVFPDQWEFVRHLMHDVSAFDATLLHHRNTWWLFAVMKENDGCSPWDELFLFHASSLFSDVWIPHPRNPVVSDVRKARPAGRIFLSGGRLIRPSQDCSKRYGYRVVFNEIITLNKREYAERPAGAVSPDWDGRIKNVHTFNYNNGLTVLDGMMRRMKWF
jgi:hypothetical protein